jgi:isochorismate synthase EntC
MASDNGKPFRVKYTPMSDRLRAEEKQEESEPTQYAEVIEETVTEINIDNRLKAVVCYAINANPQKPTTTEDAITLVVKFNLNDQKYAIEEKISGGEMHRAMFVGALPGIGVKQLVVKRISEAIAREIYPEFNFLLGNNSDTKSGPRDSDRFEISC